MVIIFIRSLIIFAVLLVLMRLMGKRQIGEMQPFEFLITLLIAELACIPMADVSIPLIYGIVAILAVFIIVLTLVKFGAGSEAERTLKITIPENLDYDGLFDDLFTQYTKHYSLERVKTTNMGTLYELQYVIVLKENQIPKAFIDEIRCRNGNLNIVCSKISEKESL